jgi:two-component system, cell cycle response regulator
MLRAFPLVAATAQAMVGDREAVLAAGFDGHVSKPIDVTGLAADLGRFLAKPAQAARETPS